MFGVYTIRVHTLDMEWSKIEIIHFQFLEVPAKSGTGAGFPWSSSRLLDAPLGRAAPAPQTPAAVDHPDDFSEGGEVTSK